MKIYSPNKNYNGITAGVEFINGIGESTDKAAIKYLKEKGYKTTEEETTEEPIEDEGEKPRSRRIK